MPFGIPRIWREPTNHISDCFFRVIDLNTYKKKSNRKNIAYPRLPSTSAPVVHSELLPVPLPPGISENSMNSESCLEQIETENSDECDKNPEYIPEDEPRLVNQQRLNDFVRDLDLTKEEAEILGSRVMEWNLLECEYTFTYRKRYQNYSVFMPFGANCTFV
nr:unnamed protein product [Callosobruchus analis]